ncbi:MAG: hypothetical protein ABH872_00710 [Candidatus Omnitrophota bacterium]
MVRERNFRIAILVFIAICLLTAQDAHAREGRLLGGRLGGGGLFSGRCGPIKKMSLRREARGKPAIFPRIRAAAYRDCIGGSCGAGLSAGKPAPGAFSDMKKEEGQAFEKVPLALKPESTARSSDKGAATSPRDRNPLVQQEYKETIKSPDRGPSAQPKRQTWPQYRDNAVERDSQSYARPFMGTSEYGSKLQEYRLGLPKSTPYINRVKQDYQRTSNR